MQLVFSARFCERVVANRAAVDLERGELIGNDGARQDILGAREQFEQQTGKAAPAWLFRLPRPPRAFVVAQGILRLDFDAQAGKIALELPDQCTPIFCCFEGTLLPPPPTFDTASLEPLLQWQPARLSLSASVSVCAPSMAEAKVVRDLMASVCGKRGELWLKTRPGVAHDVVFLVSPLGKHFSTLPELEPIRHRLRRASAAPDQHGVSFGSDAQLTAATLLTKHARYVCLSADDLQGDRLSARHEIYHLLEAEMLNDEDRQTLETGIANGRAGWSVCAAVWLFAARVSADTR